jgi:type IV secretion system protein VirB3
MQGAESQREVVIHQSANRPNLILGGDRELVLVMIIIAFALAFSLACWWGVLLSTALWIVSVGVLQRMGKADPLMRQVYMRHIRYRPFYPAKSHVWAPSAGTPANWR